eukprot:CAMPEP_0177651744 /NCGR_PEP_ID=MMETSP0447-20121125/12724_1 /TAXON_ID=0 /ORGANISM="Stygamoeba regulata, Strain BSH-02190019" /LENGTH=829 /DNA_ID=CAMNT_0019154871 /DNA_START=49 /DNA_END=2534 /DNA_ORIENTATION=-
MNDTTEVFSVRQAKKEKQSDREEPEQEAASSSSPGAAIEKKVFQSIDLTRSPVSVWQQTPYQRYQQTASSAFPAASPSPLSRSQGAAPAPFPASNPPSATFSAPCNLSPLRKKKSKKHRNRSDADTDEKTKERSSTTGSPIRGLNWTMDAHFRQSGEVANLAPLSEPLSLASVGQRVICQGYLANGRDRQYYELRGYHLYGFPSKKMAKSTPSSSVALDKDTEIMAAPAVLQIFLRKQDRKLSLQAQDSREMNLWLNHLRLVVSSMQQEHLEVGEKEITAHDWQSSGLVNKPSSCYLCRKLGLRGLMQCRSCGVRAHRECAPHIPHNCAKLRLTTREQRRFLEQFVSQHAHDDTDGMTALAPVDSMLTASGRVRRRVRVEQRASQDLLLPYLILEHRQVKPLLHPERSVTVSSLSKGPDETKEQQYDKWVSARSVSTYPINKETGVRNGDPICDQYNMIVYENRSIICVADGCSWGEKPRLAAKKAATGFVTHVQKNQHLLETTGDAGPLLLQALTHAHECIIEGSEQAWWDVGTATVLGGVLLQLEPVEGQVTNQFAFVCASVGDCKAYRYSARSKEFVDITAGNRYNFDARDPGGRLGPYGADGVPDLRNLQLFYQECGVGDLLVLVSDGVHDNLDPMHLGIAPAELPELVLKNDAGELLALEGLDWSDLSEEHQEQAMDHFVSWFVKNSLLRFTEVTASSLSGALIDHAIKATTTVRSFMEDNPTKKPSEDYRIMPGKLDHTTCVVLRVGLPENLPLAEAEPSSAASSSTSSSSSSSSSSSETRKKERRRIKREQARLETDMHHLSVHEEAKQLEGKGKGEKSDQG